VVADPANRRETSLRVMHGWQPGRTRPSSRAILPIGKTP
jgi:hypothetical protein